MIFVYGTLMRGGCRAGALADAEFRGDARTNPCYRLYDCGSYPGLVDALAGVSVTGELWSVSDVCLLRLDEIEGVAEGLYERRAIQLVDRPDVDDVEAYFYLRDISGLRDIGSRWFNP